MFEDIDRFINSDQTLDKVVYDLDTMVTTAGPTYTGAYSNHTNTDHLRFGTSSVLKSISMSEKPW